MDTCSAMGPRTRAGKKVSAPRISTVMTSSRTNSGPWVGNFPAVAETGAAGPKDMGKVIAALKGAYAGRMDFAKASGLVKEALNAKG